MLCDNIKNIRKSRGYSQEELAEKIHVSRQTVSKWESGKSVPDAEIIKSVASVLGVSVSELIEGNAPQILESEVIIDRLSGINEQLVLLNRRAKLRSRVIILSCIAAAAVLAAILGLFIYKDRQEKGYPVTQSEHLGVLSYTLPSGFYHSHNDVGVSVEGSKYRISAKSYKNYSDMTEISVWESGIYSPERTAELKKEYPLSQELPVDGTDFLPAGTEYFAQETDAGPGEDGIVRAGTYYFALIAIEGRLYTVKIINGRDMLNYARELISGMTIDSTKPLEYWIP